MALIVTQNEQEGINEHNLYQEFKEKSDNEGYPFEESFQSEQNGLKNNNDNLPNHGCSCVTKIRVLLSVLLIAFGILEISPISNARKFLSDESFINQSFINAYTVIWIGIQIIIFAGVAGIFCTFVNQIYNKCVGFVLIIAGVWYFVGQCWWLISYRSNDFYTQETGYYRRIIDARCFVIYTIDIYYI